METGKLNVGKYINVYLVFAWIRVLNHKMIGFVG